MKWNWRNPSRGIMIALLAVIAIGLGFLTDFIITCFEKNSYPQNYAEYVETYTEAYGVPESLVYAVIRTESGFDSGVVSSAGAVGLMQLMPDTFTWLTNEILFDHLESGMLYDPETNIKYGTYYLSRLYDRYGDWELALAAYNGGPGNVDEWLADPAYSDGEGGLSKIPFRETRRYVKKVTDAREVYERLYEKNEDSLKETD
ncbi:MAG: lytic transglycosylase domain-containing protein [Ruminococcaceae bacterium]|nr:lytic transglycosylase domain-containing protein [Oscillospiraceae bacterium]